MFDQKHQNIINELTGKNIAFDWWFKYGYLYISTSENIDFLDERILVKDLNIKIIYEIYNS